MSSHTCPCSTTRPAAARCVVSRGSTGATVGQQSAPDARGGVGESSPPVARPDPGRAHRSAHPRSRATRARLQPQKGTPMQDTVVTPDGKTVAVPCSVPSLTDQGWQDGYHGREHREDITDANGYSREQRAGYTRGYALGA